ncbi:MFS transporter [Psychromicrobium sp. YIM B11713]|uniref:MFS transporter n=1 Tax=Psychromicrobium sp. YIM B11713 TaxID=3145233 RepID=UPI00374F144D
MAVDASSLPPADEDWSTKPRTPLGRLVPALMLSNIGLFIALLTPLQLLLTLRLTAIANGADATAAFGIVTGCGAIVAMIASPIAGRISDRTTFRFGRRRTWILFGSITGALLLLALSVTTEVWQVVVLWCLVQGLTNFQFAATGAVMPDQVPPERRGGVSGLLGVTLAIGPLIGIALVNGFTPDSAAQWQIIAVVSVALTIIAVFLIKEQRHLQSSHPKQLNLLSLAKSFWLNPRKHPAFGWAWIVRFLITCGYAAGGYGAFYLLQRFGVSTEELGHIMLGLSSLSVVSLVLSSLLAGYLSDLVKRQKPFVIIAGVLSGGGLILAAFAPSIEWFIVSSVISAVGTGVFFSIDLAMCARVLPNTEDTGKDLAIINIANSLPQSLVPLVAPLLLALGGFPALYLSLAALGFLGSLAVIRVPEIGHEHDEGGRTAPITRTLPTR